MTQSRPRLSGVVPPVCTPLTAELDVDVASLERHVDFLIDGGVDALFVLGSTSEVAYLPDSDRRTVLQTVTARVGGQVPVIAGVIDMTTPRVIEHARAAEKLGVDGVVATAPFYTRTHPSEIERHFRLLHDAIDAPLYAYDLPVSVHSTLGADLLLHLAGDGVIAGVKDSTGDDAGMRRLILGRASGPAAARDLAVFTGSELTVDAALYMGADGTVPGLGNVDPAGYARLYRLCRAGDWAAARAEQERLFRLFDIVYVADRGRMGASSAALGAFKAALHLRGIIACPVTAPPQIPLHEHETARIAQLLREAGLR